MSPRMDLTLYIREAKPEDISQLAGLFFSKQDLKLFYRCYSDLMAMSKDNHAKPLSNLDYIAIAYHTYYGREEILGLGCFFKNPSEKSAVTMDYVFHDRAFHQHNGLAMMQHLLKQATDKGISKLYLAKPLHHSVLLKASSSLKLETHQQTDGNCIEICLPNTPTSKKHRLLSWIRGLGKVS